MPPAAADDRAQSTRAQYDLVIRSGSVVDGTRFPKFVADVGVKNGKVAKVGRIEPGLGAKEIDATGFIVAPGFIDLHTHYDAQVHWDPYCSGSGWHGFTTVGMGNCGFGFAPCKAEDRERAMLMMENTEQVPLKSMRAALPWTWETFPDWMAHLRQIPKGINMLMFMPMNPLLIYVMGVKAAKSRPATSAERAEMRRLLHEAMDAGACGFAFSNLGDVNLHRDFDGSPMPSDTMDFEEAVNLASVLRERDEGFIQIQAENTESQKEARRREEELARISGRPILHNIVQPIDFVPDFHRSAIRWIEEMHAKGLQIFGQGVTNRFWVEFTMHETNLWDGIPTFRRFSVASESEKMQLLRDAAWVAEARTCNNDRSVMYSGVGPLDTLRLKRANSNAHWARYEGCTIGEIAKSEQCDAIDVFCDIVHSSALKAILVTPSVPSTDPDLMMEALGHPLVLPGSSDGGAHVKFFSGAGYSTDLLGWLVRDEKKISLEEFHYRMSTFQARVAGITDRGTIEEGMAADIVVYDLEKIAHKLFDYEFARDLPGDEWRLVDR
ncbi:MAG: amidohydrolase family protein, partial [Caulobacterales bacterium]